MLGQPQGTLLEQLNARIKDHEKHESDRGLIGRAFSVLYWSDESSLGELKRIRQEAETVNNNPVALSGLHIDKAIKKDEIATGWQDEISHYGSSFIKAVPLFMTKGRGAVLSGLLHGSDQFCTSKSFPLAGVDFLLGFTKGVALKKGLGHS